MPDNKLVHPWPDYSPAVIKLCLEKVVSILTPVLLGTSYTNMKTDGSSPPPKRQTGQDEFYVDTLGWLLERGVLRKDMKILLVCGGQLDRDVLRAAGFENVTISNLDSQMKPGAFAPFAACVQDVEALTYGKDEFDFASPITACTTVTRRIGHVGNVPRLPTGSSGL